MNRGIFVAVIVVLTLTVAGCGGYRHATLKPEGGAITHSDWNLSLLQPSVRPLEMARAYKIMKDADARDAMLKNLMKSQSGETAKEKTYNYVFALVNNDLRNAVYIDHPEMTNVKVIAQPGGKPEYFFLRDIPFKIIYRRFPDGKIIKDYTPGYDYNFREKISHKKRIGGILVDFVLRVDEINRY